MTRPDMEAARRKAELAKMRAKAAIEARSNPQLVEMPEPTGDAEADSFADLDEVQAGFRRRAKMEAQRFADVTDSEYWFAVCFKTRAQKEAFLRAMKWMEFGDKYLPGELVAKELGIDLPDGDVALRSMPRIDPDFAGLSIEENDHA